MLTIHVALGYFCRFLGSGLFNGRCKSFYFERKLAIKNFERVLSALKLEA